MARFYPSPMYAGDDWEKVFNLRDDLGAVRDISSATYRLVLYRSKSNTAAVAEFTTVKDTTLGKVTCTYSDALSALVAPGRYLIDFIEDASGTITTLLTGKQRVLAGAT